MGAWGLGLFQSDHDYDLITTLDEEAGLAELEKRVKGPDYVPPPPGPTNCQVMFAQAGRARYVGQNPAINAMDRLNKGVEPNYSIYAHFCADVDEVRKHLDSGVLAAMLADKEERMLAPDASEEDSADRSRTAFAGAGLAGPGYEFVFLSACAMSLGCSIPEHYMNVMRKVYMCVGLMEDAVKQMDKALKKYKNGKPYDFRSLDLNQAMKRANLHGQPNQMGVVGMNTAGPGTMFYSPPKGPTAGLDELKVNFAENRYGHDACSGCGSKEGTDGTTLLDCGGCHKRKYCSTACQKKHWKAAHKKFCKTASKGDGEKTKPKDGSKENVKPKDGGKENVKPESKGGNKNKERKAWTV